MNKPAQGTFAIDSALRGIAVDQLGLVSVAQAQRAGVDYRALARRRGINYSALARAWIAERLKRELEESRHGAA